MRTRVPGNNMSMSCLGMFLNIRSRNAEAARFSSDLSSLRSRNRRRFVGRWELRPAIQLSQTTSEPGADNVTSGKYHQLFKHLKVNVQRNTPLTGNACAFLTSAWLKRLYPASCKISSEDRTHFAQWNRVHLSFASAIRSVSFGSLGSRGSSSSSDASPTDGESGSSGA